MKKVVLFAIMALGSLTIAAQSSQTNKFVDEQAVAILKSLMKKMTNYSTISIDFVFQTEKNEKILSEIKGKIHIKGDSYCLDTETQKIFCNTKSVWTYLPEQQEVTIVPYDSNDTEQLNPIKMVKDYEKNYRSMFIREQTEKGVLVQIIDLIPLKTSSIARVRLIIDKIKCQIKRSVISEKDGTKYNYIIEKFVVNQKIADNEFCFDSATYPNVDIIDMR